MSAIVHVLAAVVAVVIFVYRESTTATGTFALDYDWKSLCVLGFGAGNVAVAAIISEPRHVMFALGLMLLASSWFAFDIALSDTEISLANEPKIKVD